MCVIFYLQIPIFIFPNLSTHYTPEERTPEEEHVLASDTTVKPRSSLVKRLGLVDPLQNAPETGRRHRTRSASRPLPVIVSPPRPASQPPSVRREHPTGELIDHGEELEFIPNIPPTTSRFSRVMRPSRSNLPVTGLVREEILSALGPREETALSSLMARIHLGNRETRARLPPCSSLEEITTAVEDRIIQRRSEGREADLTSVTKQFLVWMHSLPEEAHSLDLSYRIVGFVEAKLQNAKPDRPFTLGSARKYVMNLGQVLRECGFLLDQEVIKATISAYARGGALKPEHQAKPATREDVWLACTKATETESLGLRLAWKLSSRAGEMAFLMRESFILTQDRLYEVTFPYHKGDPFRLGTVMILDLTSEKDTQLYRDLNLRLSRVNATTPVTDLTTVRATALLKSIDNQYSAHSIKRGALVTMLRAGVPIPVIQAMAKHKDLETLLVYLPRGEVAMAMGLGQGSAAL